MIGQAATRRGLTPEEYLAWERTETEKHEYLHGDVFAMAGGTHEHNAIAGNVARELGNVLRNRPCIVHPSDMRVLSRPTGLYTYPDVTVVCGKPEFLDEKRDTLLNPTVLVEVLSESTEAYDRGKKFELYRAIASVRDYVLVSQTEALVEHFVRQPDGTWNLRTASAGERLLLTSIDCAIPVDEVYLKVFGQTS